MPGGTKIKYSIRSEPVRAKVSCLRQRHEPLAGVDICKVP